MRAQKTRNTHTHTALAIYNILPERKKIVVSAKNWRVFQKSMRDGSTIDDTRGLP